MSRPSNKAKPNTRFLGRIIKETASHNAALLAKEAAEAQARLDHLTETEARKRRKLQPSASDIRRRQLGDISSILQGRKRVSGADRPDKSRPKDERRDDDRSRDRSGKREGRRSVRDGRKEDRDVHQSHGKHKDETDERCHPRRRSRSPRDKKSMHRDRSPLTSSEESTDHRHSRLRQEKSSKGHDLIDGDSRMRKAFGRLRGEDRASSSSSKPARSDDGDDSDPLDDFIGPAPPSRSPVRARGRGAARGAAAMDSRFSEDYDPTSDAQPEHSEPGDWDGAVEAFRDRQKWKQQGAERLRAAGFTAEQIKQWEKGGEKDIDDVRWSGAGEKREWCVFRRISLCCVRP